jgi:hypothetical protein
VDCNSHYTVARRPSRPIPTILHVLRIHIHPRIVREEQIEYLQKNALASILGLQVLHEGLSKLMAEVVIKVVGTVIRGASEAKYGVICRVTGWCVSRKDELWISMMGSLMLRLQKALIKSSLVERRSQTWQR